MLQLFPSSESRFIKKYTMIARSIIYISFIVNVGIITYVLLWDNLTELSSLILLTFVSLLLVFVLPLRYILLHLGSVIYTIYLNRSEDDVCDTVKETGVSLIKQNSEAVPINLLNEHITFLFNSIIIIDDSGKEPAMFRKEELKEIVIETYNNRKQLTYNDILEKWVVQ